MAGWCDGSGQITLTDKPMRALMSSRRCPGCPACSPCERCEGHGFLADAAGETASCPDCRGTGVRPAPPDSNPTSESDAVPRWWLSLDRGKPCGIPGVAGKRGNLTIEVCPASLVTQLQEERVRARDALARRIRRFHETVAERDNLQAELVEARDEAAKWRHQYVTAQEAMIEKGDEARVTISSLQSQLAEAQAGLVALWVRPGDVKGFDAALDRALSGEGEP